MGDPGSPADEDGATGPVRKESDALVRGTSLAAVLAVGLVAALFLDGARSLVRYRWDWSPEEGLFLDYARRLIEDPASLYPLGRAVPMPDFYGPGLPALLAGPVRWLDHPLPAARVLACAWSLLAALAMFRLVRPVSSRRLALLTAALPFAPFGLSFWWLIVRPDGLLVALWLWSAVALGPARLERDASVLSRRRLAAGCALTILACLTKPTAVALGAPLVLGWWFVDRDSFRRCVIALVACGSLTLAALGFLTSGGYLWVMTLWRTHPASVEPFALNLAFFAKVTAPLLAFTAAGAAWSLKRGGRPARDPAVLLLAGGAAMVPALAKVGTMVNTLLPLACALAVAGGRWWGRRAGSGPQRPSWAALGLGALAAALMVARQPFPKPGPRASLAAETFYGSLDALVRAKGGPIIAIRPEYAYFAVGEPVEIEGSSFSFLLHGQVPGTRVVLERIEAGAYTLAVLTPAFVLPVPELAGALERRYVPIGACRLQYFYGPMPVVVLAPKGSRDRFAVPPGSGCVATDSATS